MNSPYDWEHKSYRRVLAGDTGNEYDGCQIGHGSDDCSIKSSSFTVTAPSAQGSYTYEVKTYAGSSSDASYCGKSEGSAQSCTVNVVLCQKGADDVAVHFMADICLYSKVFIS